MQNIISINRSSKLFTYQELESRERLLNQRIRDLEKQIEELTQTHITIPMLSGNEVVSIDELVYCQASSNYTHIYFMDGRKICVSRTLKYVQSLLPERKFIRIHQSHLVSVQHISEYKLGVGAHVQMKTKKTLPISKSGARRIQEIFVDDSKRISTSSDLRHSANYPLKLMKN